MAHWSATLTDWGTPDWSDDPFWYGDTEKWDINRWRWEFLRRRDDYRLAFESALSKHPELLDIRSPDNMPTDRVEEDLFYHRGMRAWPFRHPDAEEFELSEFFDPIVSDWMGGGPWWPETGLLCGAFEGDKEGLISFTFDYSRPIKPQLNQAEELIEEFRSYHWYDLEKEEFKPVKNTKTRQDKWLTYLRLLDGRAAGASLSELAEVLPSCMGRRDARAAGNALEQAKAQSFRF